MINVNAHTRARIYSVLTVAAPLVVFYGLASENEVALWLAVAAAVLNAGGTALARANTRQDDF